MHELSLMADLMRKIDMVVHQENGTRATEVKVRLGALSHITPEHFAEHFEQATPGTVAEGAHLTVVQMTDTSDPDAQDIMLESVEVAGF